MDTERVEPIQNMLWDAVAEIIVGVFNRHPVQGQPEYVLGWHHSGDGMLEDIHGLIATHTLRGHSLIQSPVHLVSLGPDQTLRGPAGLVLRCDTPEPASVLSSMAGQYGVDPSDVLCIVDLRGKNASAQADSADVDHRQLLRTWRAVGSKHGLLVISEHGEASEHLLSADDFLLAAAQEGLFPSPGMSKGYPKAGPQTQVLLTHLESRDYVVRLAQEADLPALCTLEQRCWPEGLGATEDILRRRVNGHPRGQVVLLMNGDIAGAMYSQRIEDPAAIMRTTSQEVHALHVPEGAFVQLLAVNVQPEWQNLSLGDQLLEFMLQRCAVLDGVSTVVAVTRCKDYAQHPDVSPDAYISLRNAQGRLVDSVLRFHELHGAQIREVVWDYRPSDLVNLGHGVLVQYDIRHRQRDDVASPSAAVAPAGVDGAAVEAIVLAAARVLLKPNCPLALSSPLMEMGLDSADLLQLTESISHQLGIKLSATFFFEFNTCEKIIAALRDRLKVDERPLPSVADAGQGDPGESHAAASAALDAGELPVPVSDDVRSIAIVGISCRLPGGVEEPEDLWSLLTEGREALGALPADRWNWPAGIDPQGAHKGIDRGGFLDQLWNFDAGLFRISPREAEMMDPQQRMLLELSWVCLEDAGYCARDLAGSLTGVYVGASGSDYQHVLGQRCEVEAHYGLSTSMAVLANRISYFYDLNGPSLQIDTACSSSLVALNEAIRALRDGTCQQALVAGINLMINPASSVAYYKAGMLSKDGRCKTFDASADGYVRSEGAVVMLLKPLAHAQRDGDHVYAVVKGGAVNHGGQAGGLTVPHPVRQADLIAAALADAQVDATRVSYFEAHGTGTSLGDPIEIRGIRDAFKRMLPPNAGPHRMGLGSIKTNLGHLEAAAGMAGLLKVVLGLQHRTLPASLNFQQLNPQIDLGESGFYIVDKKQPWVAEAAVLRCASVSSFGSGGTNAHVVVEEAWAPRTASVAHTPVPVLVPLSAGSAAQLRQYAGKLLAHIKRHDVNMAAMAYTLQVGRATMGVRVAFIAGHVGELCEQLEAFCAGAEAIPGCFYSEQQPQANSASLLGEDDDLQELVRTWLAKAKLTPLAQAWARRLDIDWSAMHAAHKPARISLPTYPFARERYRISIDKAPDLAALDRTAPVFAPLHLHPLAQRNTSDLTEQRYSATFSGQEFFLRDHLVRGQRVLPAAAQLEMACAAVIRAAGVDLAAVEKRHAVRLDNVVFARPVVVGEAGVHLHIGLEQHSDGSIGYEVYGDGQHGDGDAPVYSQGLAVVEFRQPLAAALPLAELRAACTTELDVRSCYQSYEKMGLAYGESFRALRRLQTGCDERGLGLAVAQLELPAVVADTLPGYVLHPSVLDAALQACLSLVQQDGEVQGKTLLPFALESVQILNGMPAQVIAVVHHRAAAQERDATSRKLDVDIADTDGRVCVRLKGLTVRVLQDRADAPVDTLLACPRWVPTNAVYAAVEDVAIGYAQHQIVLCGLGAMGVDALDAALRADGTLAKVAHLHHGLAPLNTWYTQGALELLGMLQALLATKPAHPVLVQLVVPAQGSDALSSGLGGLLKSAAQENPNLVWQVLGVDGGLSPPSLAEQVKVASRCAGQTSELRCVQGRWERLVLEEVAPRSPRHASVWRDGGVYLITGGAGALGLVFARSIAEQAKGVTLVLTGRRALDERQLAQLEDLRRLGAQVDHQTVDVSQQAQVRDLVDRIGAKHGALHGVLHSAGVIRDSFVIKKTPQELREVFAAKVDALVWLDDATRSQPLDCFVVFSSTSGVFGNVGQADYAAANAFMDGYVRGRNDRVRQGQAHGRSLAVSWPLWAEGGMQIDELSRQRMWRQTGSVPLSTGAGLQALRQALDLDEAHVVVVQGNARQLRTTLLSAHVAVKALQPSSDARGVDIAVGAVPDKLLRHLKGLLAKVLKLPVERVDAKAPLEQYGMDSMLALEMVGALEQTFGSLPKTLFFEYQSIDALATYFLETHQEQLAQLLGLDKEAAQPKADEALAPPMPSATPPSRGRSRKASLARLAVPQAPAADQGAIDIAIIGLSGRYPQARDLDEYWRNLLQGVNCVVEVPGERWDYSPYFDAERGKTGKSYSKWGGFIDGVDEFDPLFFNLSPRDAEVMDPQERLFLQCVHGVLEDAGYTREAIGAKHRALGLPGNVGVFVGVMWNEYQIYAAQQGQGYALQGNVSSIANRVSYFCNFHGPSLAVDTMCSSSLTAIHLACQNILRGSCEVAIAGGVNLTIHPNKYLALAQGQFVASDGLCKSFGESGDGYVPGEGVGAVLLKPLAKAIEDGDHIYGVIKGSAVNHGGKTNGYTVPNLVAQANVVSQALNESGLPARAVSYVEAHGTGTSLGDPIEIAGLAKAFGAQTADIGYCAIGSAKSNIGHCESAAGIAGLSKVLLQMKHQTLVPSLHSQTLNPHIDFEKTPFVVQRELAPWRRPVVAHAGRQQEWPRIAGLSSFGAGGSNAHLIIEEYVAPARQVIEVSAHKPAVVVLS
ncbi:MAG: SDR family NAD(P)-dependent oxidoreductase, partial [Rubrivivax sp.]